jgi:hypothetical protein
MKKILTLTTLLVIATICFAQKDTYTIYTGKIKQMGSGKPKYKPITDTTQITDTEKVKKLYNLVQAISKNGTEDINKCFIPRDVLLIYKNNAHVSTVLICFECDGIRISDKPDTPIKNVSKREKQMKELAALMR